MLWLGVHCPQLPLEAFTRRERDEHENPPPRVVVEANRIMLCDAVAAAAGIVPGSTLATAYSIAPTLRHYRRSPTEELRRLRRLGEALYRFSAQVSLIPPAGIALEIGASLKLFGGVEAITAATAALCGELGHVVNCRPAATPLAALSLARADTPVLSEVPLQQAAIEPTCLDGKILEQLSNMGIHTLGALLDLPTNGLTERFGQGLVNYLQRLTGARPDPRRFLLPSAQFRRQLHLLAPVRSKPALIGPMTRLLTELQYWLVARQLGIEQLRWQFAPSGRGLDPAVLTVRFAQPQQRRAQLFEISRLQLERTALPEEILSLGLAAERLRPWAAGSQALFRHLAGGRATTGGGADLDHARLAELSELVERLEARLGRGVCWSPRVLDQHIPEAAWQPVAPLRIERAAATTAVTPRHRARPQQRSKRTPPATGLPAAGSTRPLWLFARPRPIASTQLTLLRGPERIETGWWTTADTRDYYVARLANGAEGWVFMDTRSRWFLHGYFG